MRKIVILDEEGLGGEELGFDALLAFGKVERHKNTRPEQRVGHIEGCEIVLTNKVEITAEIMDACPEMRYIGVLSTRYNVVDVSAAKKRGIVVANIPAYSTYAVVQHSLALLLEICNHVHLHNQAVKAGRWENSPIYCFWEKPLIELAGKTLGIYGLGRIGQGLARAGQTLGMRAISYTRTSKKLPDIEEVGLRELLERSDIFSICCPLTECTQASIAKEQLFWMKKGAILLNCASGRIVVEEDVLSALEQGQISYYLADVMAQEPPQKGNRLLRHERAIVTPHLAWAPLETRRRLAEIAVSNVRAYLEGREQNRV